MRSGLYSIEAHFPAIKNDLLLYKIEEKEVSWRHESGQGFRNSFKLQQKNLCLN